MTDVLEQAVAKQPGFTAFAFHVETLKREIAYERKRITEWVGRLQAKDHSLLYEFSWSNGMFEVAARHDVLKLELSYLEEAEHVELERAEECLRNFKKEALRAARYPEHSSSATANLAAQCKGAAFAERVEDLLSLARRMHAELVDAELPKGIQPFVPTDCKIRYEYHVEPIGGKTGKRSRRYYSLVSEDPWDGCTRHANYDQMASGESSVRRLVVYMIVRKRHPELY